MLFYFSVAIGGFYEAQKNKLLSLPPEPKMKLLLFYNKTRTVSHFLLSITRCDPQTH